MTNKKILTISISIALLLVTLFLLVGYLMNGLWSYQFNTDVLLASLNILKDILHLILTNGGI